MISSDTVTYNLFIRKLCLTEIVLTPLSGVFSQFITDLHGGKEGELNGKVSVQAVCLVAIFTLIRLWCEVTGEQEVLVGGGRHRSTKDNASEDGFLEP